MKIEEIIEGLNRLIYRRRESIGSKCKNHLVLHKETIAHPTFKAYKKHIYTLWYIGNKNNVKVLDFNILVKEKEENLNCSMDKDFCIELFSLVDSNIFEDIINNTVKDETT